MVTRAQRGTNKLAPTTTATCRTASSGRSCGLANVPTAGFTMARFSQSPNYDQRNDGERRMVGRNQSSAFIFRLTPALVGHDAFLRCVSLPQMPPQTHVQGDCNAHYDQRTHTQDQEPPDHPHSRLE